MVMKNRCTRLWAALSLLGAGCGAELEGPDAAVDVGFADASAAHDGGVARPDASSADATVPDAEAADGGSADAGGFDAGPSDAGQIDVGAADGGDLDAGDPDGGEPDASPPPPSSVLFIGNSFTLGGPVPDLVERMARFAGFDGFAPLNVDMRAVGGRTLEWHRADASPEGAPARVREGWDALVLQEYSTRPTDQVGPAGQFKIDATWFHDLARDTNPACRVVLYETWARRHDHGIYPGTFTDPMQMQSELRFHYYDAADNYIPMNSTTAAGVDVRVAPAGDAWASQLSGGEPPRLHGDDRYHAGPAGQYLNALVLYSTLFARRADGLLPLQGLDAATAQQLQDTADGVTGAQGWGARAGPPTPLNSGEAIRLDFGPNPDPAWPTFDERDGTQVDLPTEAGAVSSAYVTVAGFSGTQTNGTSSNGLGLTPEVARDSLWVGSFDGHAAALDLEAWLLIRGLPAGRYRITVFASRAGDDGGTGRLTRYTIGAETRDLQVADNTAATAVFDDVPLDRRGEIRVRVGVSPAGAGRFAYVGAVWVTRTAD